MSFDPKCHQDGNVFRQPHGNVPLHFLVVEPGNSIPSDGGGRMHVSSVRSTSPDFISMNNNISEPDTDRHILPTWTRILNHGVHSFDPVVVCVGVRGDPTQSLPQRLAGVTDVTGAAGSRIGFLAPLVARQRSQHTQQLDRLIWVMVRWSPCDKEG